MPNFLIIGPAKSATTSLYHYLNQHPEIYMSPVKEPRFFAYEDEQLTFAGPGDEIVAESSITRLDLYQALFDGVKDEVAIGEASPNYLYIPKAAERVRHYIPGAKLIAILRNPVERAYSNFMHNIRDGFEPLTDFGQALREEQSRIRNNWAPRWHYRNQGFYCRQLERFFKNFERNQLKIVLYDEFGADPKSAMRDIFRFLDVDDRFTPDVTTWYNMSGIPQSQIVNTIFAQHQRLQTLGKRLIPQKLRRMALKVRNNNLVKPVISAELRDGLMDDYKEDILRLEKLIEKDLSVWMGNRRLEHSAKLSSLCLLSAQLTDSMELLGRVV
jgi:hypothetical protein